MTTHHKATVHRIEDHRRLRTNAAEAEVSAETQPQTAATAPRGADALEMVAETLADIQGLRARLVEARANVRTGGSLDPQLRAELKDALGELGKKTEHVRAALLHSTSDGQERTLRGPEAALFRSIRSTLTLLQVEWSVTDKNAVNVTSIAREFARELRQRGPRREADFFVQDGMQCLGNSRLVRVALMEVLESAWDSTAEIDVSRIEVGCRVRRGGFWEYFVRDNGAGFDGSSSEETGFSIARHVAKLHGGTFKVHSAPGLGAEIRFTLPSAGPGLRLVSSTPGSKPEGTVAAA